MARWEYAIVEIDGAKVKKRNGQDIDVPHVPVAYANGMGEQGWELVTVTVDGESKRSMVFKRQRGAEPGTVEFH